MEEDPKEEIEWDIEDLKQAIIRNAEEYTKLMQKEKDDESVCRNSIVSWYRYSCYLLSSKVV